MPRLFLTAALSALAVAAPPLPGAGATPRNCGGLRVDPATTGTGFATAGTYDVSSFSRDPRVTAPPCRRVTRWARDYAESGMVPKGFKAKAIRGRAGRAFLRIGNEDVGFRVVLRK